MVVCRTKEEIEKIRRAGRIVAEVLRDLREMAQPGVTTRELDRYAEAKIRARGGIPTFKGYRGFPASICTSINEEVVHGIPSDRKLQEGDIVGIDCGVTLDGYVADAAITVPVGEVSEELQRLVRVTEEALFRAIAQARVGNRLYDISYAVQSYAEAHGYSVVRDFCGHGIGRQMHEDPQVPNFGTPGRGLRLRAGLVLAIEPMLNMGTHEVEIADDGWTVRTVDRKPSAHFEHTIAITERGPVILTVLDSTPLGESSSDVL
ncbi:MAG: type I methionyl aminopeptidase [Blastocatellia bacterium]|nr:type I methionyl aminopeptidase [Blastocatellia bacterium]MCS7157521.1 type I methionyl aminopeptidase [Blastocatellia bacterium]MCX7752694.1 type I methionyl aminopeptidase [Blastocatellia bacterium]MDW8168426.1 type I methionyl aminopeptidase [Acidobacteriota bacterium]MDW8255621.1 type I methionyl aminopeptidase [Acidobacteriota bacterium]